MALCVSAMVITVYLIDCRLLGANTSYLHILWNRRGDVVLYSLSLPHVDSIVPLY